MTRSPLLALLCVWIVLCSAIPTGAGAPRNAQVKPGVGLSSGLPIPRFVSLKSGRVHFRRGPSFKHPVDWIFLRKGWPVEVIGEFGPWRQVRAIDETTGWVHQQLLAGERTALVAPQDEKRALRPLYLTPRTQKPIALIEPGTLLKLDTCTKGWCEIRTQGKAKKMEGFMRADDLWGVYASEKAKP